jgi:hypothetical protein
MMTTHFNFQWIPHAAHSSFSTWYDAKAFYDENGGPALSDGEEESISPNVIQSLPGPEHSTSPTRVATPSLSSLVSLQPSPSLSGLTRSRLDKAADGNISSPISNAIVSGSSTRSSSSDKICSLLSISSKPSAAAAHSTAVNSSDKNSSPPVMSSTTTSNGSSNDVRSSCTRSSLPADVIVRLQQLINGKPPPRR